MNIAEIAKMAGVSSAAVSRYFNNGYISEEKSEAIRKVVEETGYRPSIQAQTLRTKKTKLIGVILPKIDSTAMGSVVSGILSVFDESGYQMLLADTQNRPEKEMEYLSIFDEKQVDGVIFIATVFTEEHKQALKNMTVPVIIVGQRLAGYNCVYHNDYHAVYDMTEKFIEKGKKRIGFISVFHEDKAAGLERFRGYKNAVSDAGLEECSVIAEFSLKSGYEKAKDLLKNHKNLDAIICATDSIAIGVMQYLKEIGKRVPEDILVAGHGDSTLCKVTTPTLTTIHYSYEESGELAAKTLLDNLEKKDMAVKEIMLGYSIIEQESSEISGEGEKDGNIK